MHDYKGQNYLIIIFLFLFLLNSEKTLAQSSVEDSSLVSIESIGNDMVNLLDRLSFGELDPTQRLDILPVLEKAIVAVDNSPVFQEIQAKKTYLISVRNEFDTAFNPTLSADGGLGRRSFESTASDGSTIRTTGNYLEQSITGQKLLYDFGANELQKEVRNTKS